MEPYNVNTKLVHTREQGNISEVINALESSIDNIEYYFNIALNSHNHDIAEYIYQKHGDQGNIEMGLLAHYYSYVDYDENGDELEIHAAILTNYILKYKRQIELDASKHHYLLTWIGRHNRISIMKLLVKHTNPIGINTETITKIFDQSYFKCEVFNYIINNYGDIISPRECGFSVSNLCVSMDNFDQLKIILDKLKHSMDTQGYQRCLKFACSAGCVDIVKHFDQHLNEYIADNIFNECLSHAQKCNVTKVIEYLSMPKEERRHGHRNLT